MVVDINLFTNRLQELNYSENSIHSYINCIQQFKVHFEGYEFDVIDIEVLKNHINWMFDEKKISKSYQKQMLVSIQKYYNLILNKEIDLSELYPKHQENLLPNCISKIDIRNMIDLTDNLKHKVIICLLYSAGLRLSELLNLKINDIDIPNKIIHIHQAKDKNERTVMLSPTLLEKLQQYYQKYNPKQYVFEGQSGEVYTGKSVQQVVKQAAAKAGIIIPVTPHCLRHSFASHLLENGTDIHHVQELMGHQSIKTTENYLHTSEFSKSNIQSPLDTL